jgi:hypothetical protein
MSPLPIRSPATTVYSCSNEIIVCWSKNCRSADALKQGKAEIANRNPNLDVGSPTEAASRANAIYFRDGNKSPSPTDRLFARTSSPIARAAVFFAGALATTRRIASICIGAFILGDAGLLDGRRATSTNSLPANCSAAIRRRPWRWTASSSRSSCEDGFTPRAPFDHVVDRVSR